MTSPLLPYANSYVLFEAEGIPEVSDGRIITGAGSRFLVECYLKRQESNGVETGADYLPLQSNSQDFLPGSSGQVYLYRGYALRYIEVSEDYEAGVSNAPANGWVNLSANNLPIWLTPGANCIHIQGNETAKNSSVERSTGKYGGSGIDSIISSYIVGIPLIIRSGDFTG